MAHAAWLAVEHTRRDAFEGCGRFLRQVGDGFTLLLAAGEGGDTLAAELSGWVAWP